MEHKITSKKEDDERYGIFFGTVRIGLGRKTKQGYAFNPRVDLLQMKLFPRTCETMTLLKEGILEDLSKLSEDVYKKLMDEQGTSAVQEEKGDSTPLEPVIHIETGTPSNDPFAEGTEAFDSGKSETENPYPEEGEDFLSWNDGWLAADADTE